MASWDLADVVARVRTEIRKDSNADFPLTADLQKWVSDEESDLLARFAVTAPESNYGVPVLLTSADGGKTFTFGVDADANPITPLGEYELYRSLEAIPSSPMTPFVEFMPEADRIRMPGNRTYTGPASGPYARFVNPTSISAAALTVKPVQARIILVHGASERYFRAAGQFEGADVQQAKKEEKFLLWLVNLRTQAEAMNAEAGLQRGASGQMWYSRTGDLG